MVNSVNTTLFLVTWLKYLYSAGRGAGGAGGQNSEMSEGFLEVLELLPYFMGISGH